MLRQGSADGLVQSPERSQESVPNGDVQDFLPKRAGGCLGWSRPDSAERAPTRTAVQLYATHSTYVVHMLEYCIVLYTVQGWSMEVTHRVSENKRPAAACSAGRARVSSGAVRPRGEVVLVALLVPRVD